MKAVRFTIDITVYKRASFVFFFGNHMVNYKVKFESNIFCCVLIELLDDRNRKGIKCQDQKRRSWIKKKPYQYFDIVYTNYAAISMK